MANQAWAEAGVPAATGAQRGAILQSTSGSDDAVDYTRMVYSDDEVQLRSVAECGGQHRQQRRSSGYISDGQEAQRGDNRAVVDDNVTQRRPVLKSLAEFVSPGGEWHRQPSSPSAVN